MANSGDPDQTGPSLHSAYAILWETVYGILGNLSHHHENMPT